MKTLKERLLEKLRSPGFQDHKFSMERRELIKLGLVAGGGALFPLSLVERTFAQVATNTSIPFLVFDLAGGAALPGNFLVGQAGGPEDFCRSYQKLGWNPRASGALDKTFGLPMSKKHSQILAGLKETLPREISENPQQSFFKMGSFCHFSLDDTQSNQISAVTMVARSGARGKLFRNPLGQFPTESGGNSDVLLRDSRFRPKAVGSVEDVLRVTSYGLPYEQMDAGLRQQIFSGLERLVGSQSPMGEIYKNLAQLGTTQPQMDPTTKNLSQALGPDERSVEGTIIYNAIAGLTGPGVITIGGCDYHTGEPNAGAQKDREIGQKVGRAVATAFALKKPLMFQMITDGGVYSRAQGDEDRAWGGDRPSHSMTIVGYFDPNGKVEMRTQQIGHYNAEGEVETKTDVGASPERTALAVAVNYLHLSGQLDRLELAAGVRLQPEEIDKLLVFG